jgi:hypothetical protein
MPSRVGGSVIENNLSAILLRPVRALTGRRFAGFI